MASIRAIKYLFVFSLPIISFFSWQGGGWWSFLTLFYTFGFIPLLELIIKPDHSNLPGITEEVVRDDSLYDWMLYLVLPVQYFLLFNFLRLISHEERMSLEIVGYITTMGILCGVMGINVAHELGHRKKRYEQFLSKLLLLTSLYMHFFIEHNRGHHKNVSTDDDPASARRGESLYRFLFRSVFFSYISAWRLEKTRLARNKRPQLSIGNEMILFQGIQFGFIVLIYVIFGPFATAGFMAAALIGIMMLETVNYIEHYGLRRQRDSQGKWGRVLPQHSWNSDHILGRLLLFELSRHSDHHYNATRKYQVLRNHDESPQMPTGYPGMMLLSLVPPLWFRVMDRRIIQ